MAVRHVEHCMGTVFSFDIRDDGDWTAAITDAVVWLHRVDRIFSTYKTDSDITRMGRGELALAEADPLVREVATLCSELEATTEGYFSAHYGGAFDPTGLVKGWAVEHASRILHDHGSRNHAVNGGGDVQTCGASAPGAPWRIGVIDPDDPTRISATFTGFGIAVATSGTAERGLHIVDPVKGVGADDLRSVSVSGSSLTTVDAYATAAAARGSSAARWLRTVPDVRFFVVPKQARGSGDEMRAHERRDASTTSGRCQDACGPDGPGRTGSG